MKPWIGERWVRVGLRATVIVVMALVAVNALGRWWYWEVEAAAAGLVVSPDDRFAGRLALLSAAAALTAGVGLYDLLGSLPAVRTRARIALALAALLAVLPRLAGT